MSKKKGFTLIELLVVIAIIALLMSILMPALSKVRKQALAVSCQSRLKQWGVIFSMYTNENGGLFHQREVGTPLGYSRMWPYTYQKMYIDPKMRFCPTAVNPAVDTGPFGTWNYGVGSYYPLPDLKMPGEREYEKRTNQISDGFFTGSYGMNRYAEDMKGGTFTTDPAFWRRADERGGDQVPVLLDCQYLYFWDTSDGIADPPAYNGDYSNYEMKWACVDRHMGYNNICFLDSSVRKVGLKELYTLKHSRKYDTCNPSGWTICSFSGNRQACAAAWDTAAAWMSKMPEY
jgi:prepilin-type N-terminal cleavage/methylation domain-containing protein/prepilin-type processing-associated H-X9-DG protein